MENDVTLEDEIDGVRILEDGPAMVSSSFHCRQHRGASLMLETKLQLLFTLIDDYLIYCSWQLFAVALPTKIMWPPAIKDIRPV